MAGQVVTGDLIGDLLFTVNAAQGGFQHPRHLAQNRSDQTSAIRAERNLYGLLFPREAALKELLTLITTHALTHIWAEDEAIGCVYQYFNSQEER